MSGGRSKRVRKSKQNIAGCRFKIQLRNPNTLFSPGILPRQDILKLYESGNHHTLAHHLGHVAISNPNPASDSPKYAAFRFNSRISADLAPLALAVDDIDASGLRSHIWRSWDEIPPVVVRRLVPICHLFDNFGRLSSKTVSERYLSFLEAV